MLFFYVCSNLDFDEEWPGETRPLDHPDATGWYVCWTGGVGAITGQRGPYSSWQAAFVARDRDRALFKDGPPPGAAWHLLHADHEQIGGLVNAGGAEGMNRPGPRRRIGE